MINLDNINEILNVIKKVNIKDKILDIRYKEDVKICCRCWILDILRLEMVRNRIW